jgi:hypothetical protein
MKKYFATCNYVYIMFEIDANTYKEACKVPKKVYPLPYGTYGIRVVSEDYVKQNKIEWYSDSHPTYCVRENGTLSQTVYYDNEKAYMEAFENAKRTLSPVTYTLSQNPKYKAEGVLEANLTDYDYANMIQHECEVYNGWLWFREYPKNYSESTLTVSCEFLHGEFD